jgi:hypothetical protein
MATSNGAAAAAAAAAAAPSNGSGVDPRLVRLREAMSKVDGGKGVTAYIVPTEDPHMSEYPPATYQRREYISRCAHVCLGQRGHAGKRIGGAFKPTRTRRCWQLAQLTAHGILDCPENCDELCSFVYCALKFCFQCTVLPKT